MAHRHQEFWSRLDDAKKLRLYAQSVALHHQTLTASLAKAESSSERWEKEARDGATSVIRAEKERNEAKQEARVANMIVAEARDTKAKEEVDLTKALKSLAAAEEGGCRSKAKIASLKTEFTRVDDE